MQALLGAREPNSSDDDPAGKTGWRRRWRAHFGQVLRVPCLPCGGGGWLRLTDALAPRGRRVRCPRCRGAGTVRMRI
jgi:hypothetical protein